MTFGQALIGRDAIAVLEGRTQLISTFICVDFSYLSIATDKIRLIGREV